MIILKIFWCLWIVYTGSMLIVGIVWVHENKKYYGMKYPWEEK